MMKGYSWESISLGLFSFSFTDNLNDVLFSNHFIIELFLVLIIVYLLVQKARPPRRTEDQSPLTEREVDMMCLRWKLSKDREPLAPAAGENLNVPSLLDAPRVILDSAPASYVDLYLYPPSVNHTLAFDFLEALAMPNEAVPPTDDKAALVRNVFNLASSNFLGLAGDDEVSTEVDAATNKYGVGSCGPRGFYGTIDVHLKLEEELASFVGYKHAVLYSYDVATPQSVIPAFAKKGDVAIVDERCSYAIRSGLALARATVIEFAHNDMKHLEEQLRRVRADRKLVGEKGKRRLYIVVEGVYANVGTVCPLAKVVQLKEAYNFRLYVDDSFGFGVMGHSGRGTFERYGVPVSSVDVYTSSLSNSMGSVGGFCCTHETRMDIFQRLNASGYVFSASLPPLLAAGAIGALRRLRASNGKLPATCRANAAMVRNWLARMTTSTASAAAAAAAAPSPAGAGATAAPPAPAVADGACPDGVLHGLLSVRDGPDGPPKDGDTGASPLVHLELSGRWSEKPWHEQQRAVCAIARRMIVPSGVLVGVPLYSEIEGDHAPTPSLKLCVSSSHTPEALQAALMRLASAAQAELPQAC